MRTYVKIEGKDVELIVQKLAKLAVDSPEICVWDYNMQKAGWFYPIDNEGIAGDVADYLGMDASVLEKDCNKIIAKSGADLGDKNIYFEWQITPTEGQLANLMNKIDDVLKPFSHKYEVTNKK